MPATAHADGVNEIEASGGGVHWLENGGVRLRAAFWPGAGAGTMLFLHGRTEFIEKYIETVAELRQRGFAVWTLDWRGQGRSTRLLADPVANHVRSFDDYLQDLDSLLAVAEPSHAPPFLILGQSMGAHLALRLMARRPDVFEHAVLVAPMIDFLRPNRMPLRAAHLLASLACTVPGMAGRFAPGTPRHPDRHRAFEANPLTSCTRRFAADLAWLDHPGLAVGGATWGWIRAASGSIAAMRRPAFAAGVTTPLLMVLAGADRLVDNAAARRLAQRLPNVRLIEIDGARHEILREHDTHQAQFWAAFDAFIQPTSPFPPGREPRCRANP